MILVHQLNTENNFDFLFSVLLVLIWKLIFSHLLDEILSIHIIRIHLVTFIYKYNLLLSTKISSSGK